VRSQNGTYYPYGEEYTPTGQDGDKFATYFGDAATNLQYAKNRYYSSAMGRFLTPDPYRASGGPADPGSWNRYAYVEGDPVNDYDEWGLDPCPVGTPPETGNSVTVCEKLPPPPPVLYDFSRPLSTCSRVLYGNAMCEPYGPIFNG
jgi:RHS repeat-associated protein